MTTTEVMELASELERMTRGTALAVPPGWPKSTISDLTLEYWARHVHERPEWCKALYSVLRSAELRLQAEATAVERTAERDRAERALADAHRVRDAIEPLETVALRCTGCGRRYSVAASDPAPLNGPGVCRVCGAPISAVISRPLGEGPTAP